MIEVDGLELVDPLVDPARQARKEPAHLDHDRRQQERPKEQKPDNGEQANRKRGRASGQTPLLHREADDRFKYQSNENGQSDRQQDRIRPAEERDEAEKNQRRHTEPQRHHGQRGQGRPENAPLLRSGISGLCVPSSV